MSKHNLKTNSKSVFLSIIIPVFNEEENINPLYHKTISSLKNRGYKYEIIFIDDGSTDKTLQNLLILQKNDGKLRIVKFPANRGKSDSYTIGFKLAKGDMIITMDGDLQDDPAEINKFVEKMEEGYDAVIGWKYKGKGLPSYIFNKFESLITGIPIHDFNCPFKAFRKSILKDFNIYGELYRFIPILLHKKGFKVGEIKIENYPRIYGKSKYGLEKFMRGLMDFLTVLFITKYKNSPLHFFGFVGGMFVLTGLSLDAFLTIRGIFFTGRIGHLALLLMGIFLIIVGFQFLSVGLLGELIISGRERNISYSEHINKNPK